MLPGNAAALPGCMWDRVTHIMVLLSTKEGVIIAYPYITSFSYKAVIDYNFLVCFESQITHHTRLTFNEIYLATYISVFQSRWINTNHQLPMPLVSLFEYLPSSNCITNERTKKCDRCKKARYCSRVCQVEHWKKTHKVQCEKTDQSIGVLFSGTTAKIALPTVASNPLARCSVAEGPTPQWHSGHRS
jgi:MYND finger